MQNLQTLFDELGKLHEQNPEKILTELRAFVDREFNYLARIGNLVIIPTEIAIPEGKAQNLEERLQELMIKFSSGVYLFSNQSEWYESAKFIDQSADTGHLCKVMDWIRTGPALLGLQELGVSKKFSLSKALLFAEKVFDDELIESGKSLSIMLSEDCKVAGSSCYILVEHHPNGEWELSFYLYSSTAEFSSNSYILCA